MNFFDQCKQCSVIVDNGSGVLFQPMTEEYSYILTAKHNLYNDAKQGSYKEPKDKDDIKITFCDGNDKQIIDKYEHDSLDIAILKIDKIEFESPYKEFIQPNNGYEFKFYGYPEKRRNETEKISYFDLNIGDITGFEITASNKEYFPKEYINGCSGGGVFKQDGDNFYLVGIEYRMDAQSEEEVEQNVRVKYIDIKAFDEIIEQDKSELTPLYPPYMKDFNLLIENIFLLIGMENHEKKLIQDRLKLIATNLSKNLNPIVIKNKFENELLVRGLSINEFSNKELWSMYLEFLVISVFLDSSTPISIEAVENIYKKRKVLFVKASNWIDLKEQILTSNLYRLNKDGDVIICCDGDRTPTRLELKGKSLVSIANAIMPEDMRIDSSIGKIDKDLKFKHIHIVQNQMINDYDDGVYDSATATNIEGIIKDEINKAFN